MKSLFESTKRGKLAKYALGAAALGAGGLGLAYSQRDKLGTTGDTLGQAGSSVKKFYAHNVRNPIVSKLNKDKNNVDLETGKIHK